MEFNGIDVHMTYGFDVPWYDPNDTDQVTVPVNKSALSLAVTHGAVNCVAYLKEMGARSHDRLSGSGYGVDLECMGFRALREELDKVLEAEAKERWVNFARTKFGLAEDVAEVSFSTCCYLIDHSYFFTKVTTMPNVGWSESLVSHEYCKATYDMYHEAEYNALQLANLKHGRDALITRLVRGERKEIAKSYKLGFAALRYYADNQRASLLLAKNDDRLWLILMKLATVNMPVELREKIVDFAFFGKDAPERKANKAVENKSDV